MEYGEGQGKGVGLETVRALHQTVTALRKALEESKNEILQLKSKSWPIESVQETLKHLSVENHILRRKLLDISPLQQYNKLELENVTFGNKETEDKTIQEDYQLKEEKPALEQKTKEVEVVEDKTEPKGILNSPNNPKIEEQSLGTKKVRVVTPKSSPRNKKRKLEAKILIKAESIKKNISKSLESLTIIKSPLEKNKSVSFSKSLNFSGLSKNVKREFKFDVDEEVKMTERKYNDKQPTENDIVAKSNNGMVDSQNDLDQGEEVDDIELIFTTDDTKESDFKEELVSIEAQDGPREAHLLQPPHLEHDASFDVSDKEIDDDDVFHDNFENGNQEWKRENSQLCDSKSDTSINQDKSMKSYYSMHDSSFENKSLEKDESFDRFEERIRIIETDISKCGIQDVEYVVGRRNTCPNPLQYRPLVHREAITKGLTLNRKSRPILTHSNAIRKDSGAQTDISALPGSSWRSESSLANKAQLGENFMTLPSKCPHPGSRLRLSEKTVEARRVLLSDIGFTSMVPELSRSADHLFPPVLKPVQPPTYGQFLRATDLYSPGYNSQKFNWTANTASPSEGSQTQSHYSSIYPLSSPPAPSRRCSAPVSPSRKAVTKETPSRVRFANGSLPELRGDWTTVDSGDSTDSLVEEAENFLRRSIDCIVSGREGSAGEGYPRRLVPRRASAPEPCRDNVPPVGWQPFLPRFPHDLRLDHWVKVITPEGRVRGGRVRYVGPVVSQIEQFVGVQLSNPDGYCDGTYNNRRYFQCERLHGIFVPFKKVIMGWRP